MLEHVAGVNGELLFAFSQRDIKLLRSLERRVRYDCSDRGLLLRAALPLLELALGAGGRELVHQVWL